MVFSDNDLTQLKKATKRFSEVTLPGNLGAALLSRLEASEKICRLVTQGFGGHVLEDAIMAWKRSIVKESD